MSINITVHNNKLKSETGRNILCDAEEQKKVQFANRRKQRLEQVRQQSKDLASKVRRNVSDEKQKQERRIEEMKQKELLQWRQKALAECEERHKKCLDTVGTAHRAALEEREAAAKGQQKLRSDAARADRRGREALQKERERIAERSAKKKKIDAYVPRIPPKRKSDENSRNVANVAKGNKEKEATTTSSSSSLDVGKQAKTPLKKNKVVVMDVNTDSDSSTTSLQDSHEESNRHFYRTTAKSENTKSPEKPYKAGDYKATDSTISDQSNSIEARPPRQFTQISDLIQKRQSQLSSVTSLDIPAATTEPSCTSKSCLKTGKPSRHSDAAKSESSNTVQFYDYDGKYSKRYEPKVEIVTPVPKSKTEPSAMESARLEREQQEKDRKAAEELRKKTDERSRLAMERERIRRDCEELIRKLDSLNRENPTLREIDGRGINAFTKIQMEQQAVKRQLKLNDELVKLVNRRAVTCPKIVREPPPSEAPKPKRNVFNVADLAEKPGWSNFEIHESSDSCASILLDYVDKQSEQISQDIQKSESSLTRQELECLLLEVNKLRETIINELNKCTAKKAAAQIENIAKSVTNLRKKREDIMSEDQLRNEGRKAELDRREQRLKEKEQRLHKTLKDLAKTATTQSQKLPAERDEVAEPRRTTSPVKIIIKVTNETAEKPKRHYRTPRKRSSLIDVKTPKRKKVIVKTTTDSIEQGEFQENGITAKVAKTSSTTSTTYLDPPDAITTKLGQLLSASPVQEIRVPPVQQIPADPSKKPEPKKKPEQKASTNPVLMHYIQRLLAMSRDSIDMLGVSTSEIETPSSSVVQNSTNLSDTSGSSREKDRLDRMQQFINENYSFINELEESLKSSSSTTSTDKKMIQRIWQEALQRKQTQRPVKDAEVKPILKKREKREKRERSQPRDTSKPAEVPTIPVDESKPMQSDAPKPDAKQLVQEKLRLADKYTELTENCARRITELTEMINRVRKEKQKILEITLTSGSETNRTEYLDFAENLPESLEDSAKAVEAKPASPDRVNLEKNKLTGASRDSGISLSRPVTALDSRGTPDSRFDRTTPDYRIVPIERKQREPEPPLPEFRITPIERKSREPEPELSLPEFRVFPIDRKQLEPEPPLPEFRLFPIERKPREPEPSLPQFRIEPYTAPKSQQKHDKPPPSITRYTPILTEQQQRHELSTILEVETPATSRLNASFPDKNISTFSAKHVTEIKEYVEFPTFEEYARKHNIDLKQLDLDDSPKVNFSAIAAEIEGTAEYHEFPTLSTFLREQPAHSKILEHTSSSSTTSSTTPDIAYEPFPSFKTYAKQHGFTEASQIESLATSSVSISDNPSSSKESASVESSESLPDVVAELKRRNLLKHSFRNDTQIQVASQKELSASISSSISGQIRDKSRSPTKKAVSPRNSPRKKSSPQKDKSKTKEKAADVGLTENISGIELIRSLTSSHDDTDSLQRELDAMGLGWAAQMLKKSQKSMELSSTSSSFTYQPQQRKSGQKSKDASKSKADDQVQATEKQHEASDTSAASDRQQPPINLKQFLSKELQKLLSGSSTSSSLTSEDSMAGSLLRSLFETVQSTPRNEHERMTRERLRTSTPVLGGTSSKTSSETPPKDIHESTKVFSGESGLSSVRLSSGSSNGDSQIKEACKKTKYDAKSKTTPPS